MSGSLEKRGENEGKEIESLLAVNRQLQRSGLLVLGWDEAREASWLVGCRDGAWPARVIAAIRGHYQILRRVGDPPLWASHRSSEGRRADPLSKPAVGDWVSVIEEGDALRIDRVLKRRSSLVRKAAGREARPQIVAANVDRVFIVTTVGEDLNARRLERYLAAVWDGGTEPVIVVNKTDVPHDATAIQAELSAVARGAVAVMASANTARGLDSLLALCEPRRTVALVGSSGVGKSTIVNRMVGSERQLTAAVRHVDQKGRHTTTRQELFITPGGAILIDTPGMREFGLWDAEAGVERAFEDLIAFADACRFGDCAHGSEPGCAVQVAIEGGELDPARLASYSRLRDEMQQAAESADRRAGGRRRWKEISKAARSGFRVDDDLDLKRR